MSSSTTPVPALPSAVVVPAPVDSGAIACLDFAFTSADWASILVDATVVARALGLEHFILRSANLAPYCPPNPSPPNHRHHLLSVLGLAKAARNRGAQFLLVITPDNDTWQMVQYFCLIQQAIAVECIRGAALLGSSTKDRFLMLERALTCLNSKLGGCNRVQVPFGGPVNHTLVLGASITHVAGTSTPTFHCALVGAADCQRACWFTDTSIQTGQTHCIKAVDRMLLRILAQTREPISRILYIRSSIPPLALEETIEKERSRMEAAMLERNGRQPRFAFVVPWGSDEDASCAETYETVKVAGQSYAVPFNDFGRGWDINAIGRFLSTLTFHFAYDNSPTAFPAPLKYASAASNSVQVHYYSGRPTTPNKPIVDYREVARVISSTPYWL